MIDIQVFKNKKTNAIFFMYDDSLVNPEGKIVGLVLDNYIELNPIEGTVFMNNKQLPVIMEFNRNYDTNF